MHSWLRKLVVISLFHSIGVADVLANQTMASHAHSGLRYRYAYSADGYNQDRDDIAGSAMVVALFDMGSDGYVWARNFSVKDPQQRGQLEIDRHWYNFMLWGRLGYDPSLDRSFFEATLKQRYPEADAALLYDTWAASSRIIPQVNRFFFKPGDFQFTPEGCQGLREGFLTVDHFIAGEPLPGMPEISITDYLKLDEQADRSNVRTPPQVARNLDRFAADTLRGCEAIHTAGDLSSALAELVTDLQAMAWLGHYYADKIRGATALARYRERGEAQDQQHAIAILKQAQGNWRRYADLMHSQYRTQVMARGQDLDWELLADVAGNDIKIAKEAKSLAK